MSHVDDGRLHAYLDGELSAAEAQRFDAHLAQCPACRARLDEERALITRAGELLALAAPPDRELRPFRAGDVKPPPRLWWRVRMPLAWAATVALALGIGTYLGETGGTRLAPPSPARSSERADRLVPSAPALDTPVAVERQRRGEQRVQRAQASPPSPSPASSAVGMLAEEKQDSLAALAARDEAVAAPESRRMVAKVAAAAPSPPEPTRLSNGSYVLKGGSITADSARLALGRDPLVVPDLPILRIYRGQMSGYSGIVVVEQALDSNTAIEVINGRPLPLALQEVVVTGAGAARADSAKPAERRLLPASDFFVDVRGPLPPDSLAALKRRLHPLPH